MKNFTRIVSVIVFAIVCLQVEGQITANQIIVTPEVWDQMKAGGNSMFNMTTRDPNASHIAIQPVVHAQLNSQLINCSGEFAIDSIWSVVPFTTGTAPYYRNDDGSSPLITLPF